MEKSYDWIQDLVRGEQHMEEAGVVDFSPAFDPANVLLKGSIEFLKGLKSKFIKASSIFNQLKRSQNGHIKIYGISRTHADFMLFRNGYKLIFSLSEPGKVTIQFHHMSTPFLNENPKEDGANTPSIHSIITAQWGAFGEIVWQHKSKEINPEYLVRFFMKNFVHNSSK